MMDSSTSSELKIIQTPSLEQIQTVTVLLENQQIENPNLELALNYLLQHKIIPHKQGGLVAIAYTPSPNNSLDVNNIQGIMMARTRSTSVLIESCNYETAKSLLQEATQRSCPQQVCSSLQTKNWIHPLLLQQYSPQRECEQFVMVCKQIPLGGVGRWAISQDKPVLQAYAAAYLAERGSGSLNHPWDNWIQKRNIAVLEYENQIVSVVRYTTTRRDALVIAPFTFPQFRRRGFARKLLVFLLEELLQTYPRVRLWVNKDNAGAIALYKSLEFQIIGQCYSSYWK
ncbi:GNAT family N-acetyltransferase [Calothrix sp. NIES-3974]|uniref:GNAT family N-acetyltransferase n=1 Tax=Calothrix sp. NIES-3974 TaxID=2005462 RepID=UPI000B5E412B|nr:GNAT family N-acetyltransferase [Calothrix sp. NIES-3974]BAZ06598.1 Mycothiol acetyltransferase [Calothrix sp. NIES-3974]